MSYYYSILEAQMKAQEEEEKKKKKEEAIKKSDEERKKEKDTEPVKSVNERIKQKKAVKENYINFKADVNDFLLETFLYTIVDKAMTKTAVTENTDNFRRGLIHEYVTTNGFYRIMDKMRTQNTLFLSESVKFIEEYASLITENADEDDIETHAIDHNNREEFYKDLDDESIESIADIIRRRVSQSTEEFMNKNIVDDINIKDIMLDTKEKITGY